MFMLIARESDLRYLILQLFQDLSICREEERGGQTGTCIRGKLNDPKKTLLVTLHI